MSESSTVTQDGTKDGTDGISDEERRRHHHHHHHHPHHIEQEKLEIDVTKLNANDASTVEISVMASQKAEEFMTLDPEGQRKFLSDLFTGLHQQKQNKELVEGIFDHARKAKENQTGTERYCRSEIFCTYWNYDVYNCPDEYARRKKYDCSAIFFGSPFVPDICCCQKK